jgi:small subunit ribosomal protein S5
VAGELIKKLLSLAGVRDAWTKTFGSTSTLLSTTQAVYKAFYDMHRMSDLRRFES